jgi:hypothetical protein
LAILACWVAIKASIELPGQLPASILFLGMAETVTLHPQSVEYDSVTGVPSEFNDFLPKDSDEYKK